MYLRKIILLAIIALPLAGCDSKKPETNASSYTSQSEILDMQEEQEKDAVNESANTQQRDEYRDEYNDVSSSGDQETETGTGATADKQEQDEKVDSDYGEKRFESDREKIDNTSSEADDTVY